MIVRKLLKYITGKRIRQTLKQSLSMAGAFYILDLHYSLNSFIDIKSKFVKSENIIAFLFIYGIIIFLFYPVFDFILRFLFLRIIRTRILRSQKKDRLNNRFENLRILSSIKRGSVKFVFDYPIRLGYANRKDFGPVEKITPTETEKEEVTNEIIGKINNWTCSYFHLIISLLVVSDYYPLLMSIFLIAGIVFFPIVISGIIISIENVEVFVLVLNEIHKKTGVTPTEKQQLIK